MKLGNENILSGFKGVVKIHPTGSRYICDPPPTDTDEDYVVLINSYDNLLFITDILRNHHNFEVDGNYTSPDSDFISIRKGEINLILTDSIRFYDNFIKATKIAKEENLLDKKERVALFERIMKG